MKEKVVLCWSGGKDSAMALHEIQRSGRYEVMALLTTLAREYDRVSHHGVRGELMDQQAAALGLPLDKLYLSVESSSSCRTDGTDGDAVMTAYEKLMDDALSRHQGAGVNVVAFGDIFLERLRAYREERLARRGMTGLFPLWKRDTRELAQAFVDQGFRAYLSCVDGDKLGEGFAGRPLDQQLLDDLPAGVDPCGENGEYHSFVYDGPVFRAPVAVEVGEVVQRDVRWFADLRPRTRECRNSQAFLAE